MLATVLMENRSPAPYRAEHGLCVHIAYRGKNYLLDTAKSGAFLENASRLGIDISKVHMAFLSHGHYDHSGGYPEFFEINKTAKVYLRETAGVGKHLSQKEDGLEDIGIPEGVLESYPDRFQFVSKDMQPDQGVWLIGHHTQNLRARAEAAGMYWEKNGETALDDFSHEQSLVFETAAGLAVFNSCCHAGVDCVVKEISDTFPGQHIAAVIGGFHLMGSGGADTMAGTEAEVRKLAEKLMEEPVDRYYTGHCTGMPAYQIMKETMGDRLVYFSTGSQLELPENR